MRRQREGRKEGKRGSWCETATAAPICCGETLAGWATKNDDNCDADDGDDYEGGGGGGSGALVVPFFLVFRIKVA
jgi:hypothetical protein